MRPNHLLANGQFQLKFILLMNFSKTARKCKSFRRSFLRSADKSDNSWRLEADALKCVQTAESIRHGDIFLNAVRIVSRMSTVSAEI